LFSRKKYHRKTSTLLSIIAFLFLHSLFCVNTFNADEIFESIDSSLGEITVFFSDEKQKDSINISEIEIEEVPETIDSYSSLIGLNIENSTSETEIDKLVLEFKNIIDPLTVCKVYQLKENVLNPVNSKFSNNSIQLNNIEPGLLFVVFSYENEKTEKSGQFSRSILIDGIEICVNAEAYTFPENVSLSVALIEETKKEELDSVVDEERSDDTNVAKSYSFDIKIIDSEGNEIQPAEGKNVQVSFSLPEVANENLETSVYHIEEEDNELVVQKLEVETEGKTATFETEGFSYYTVEFTYNNKEFVLEGDSDELLKTILEAVSLSGESIKPLAVSNTELIAFEEREGQWVVKSLAPFITNEWMTVEIDGVEYKIILTDRIAQGWFGGGSGDLYWEITDNYKLIIRPKDSMGGASGSADFQKSFEYANDWPWNSYRSQIKEVEFQGSIGISGIRNLNRMFENCTSLTKVTGLDYLDTSNSGGLARMFSGCTSLTEIDLSSLKNDGNMQNMQNMFRDCTNLKTVIMPSSDFKVRENALLASMFEGCNNLTNVDFSGGMNVTKAKTMTNMFKDCFALEKLDVSSFGTLTDIINMDGFIEGCRGLKELILDNLDNSNIGPYSDHHTLNDVSKEDSMTTGAREYGREIFGKVVYDIPASFPNLKTISAKNSNIWMAKNNRGKAGSEYYISANENDVL